MPVITLVSAKGSPGVTTAAAALAAAATLRGETVLVELDPAGGDVQAYTGVVDDPGVVRAAGALRREVSGTAIGTNLTEAPPSVPALLAPTAGLMAASVIGSVVDRWRPALHELGGTVVVDAGRWEASQPTARRVSVGDVLALVCRPSVASVEHARHVVNRLREVARQPIVALVVGLKPYAPAEVAAQLEIPLGGAIAWDPRATATMWSKGVVRSWGRTFLASSAAESLTSLLSLARPTTAGEPPVARRPVAPAPSVGPPVPATPASAPFGRPVRATPPDAVGPTPPRTGEVPAVARPADAPTAPRTGEVPAVPRTGEVPVVSRTGAPTPARTGEAPAVAARAGAPTAPRTGEVPAVRRTVEVHAAPRTGEGPVVGPAAAAPVAPRTGEVAPVGPPEMPPRPAPVVPEAGAGGAVPGRIGDVPLVPSPVPPSTGEIAAMASGEVPVVPGPVPPPPPPPPPPVARAERAPGRGRVLPPRPGATEARPPAAEPAAPARAQQQQQQQLQRPGRRRRGDDAEPGGNSGRGARGAPGARNRADRTDVETTDRDRTDPNRTDVDRADVDRLARASEDGRRRDIPRRDVPGRKAQRRDADGRDERDGARDEGARPRLRVRYGASRVGRR
ncbi:MAG TPA: hypothetical protein VKA65_09405 [Acidimicrobiales bacterium]|nr:hypothetical protein [Acidimicrobiales bacterium]